MKLYNTITTFIFPSTTTTPHFYCFPPPPPHFCCFSPPPPHFYCFHSSTTTTITTTTITATTFLLFPSTTTTTTATFLLFSSSTTITTTTTATTFQLFSLHHHHHHISIASILRPLVSFFSLRDSIKDCQLPSLVHFVAMSRVANNNRGFLQLLADCPIVSSLGFLML